MGYDYQTADPTLYSLLKDMAKINRSHPTEAESILWEYLKGGSLGVPFKRQHIIGEFIADFVCIPRKLIIEVDGGYHQIPDKQISDMERQEWLYMQGVDVIRFTNEEIIGDIDSVLETIEQQLNK